jgi:aminoglycoside 6-adenylyltransferase
LRSEEIVLDQLRKWADSWENVRAVILTSSRADPRSKPDILSDYDVQVFVRDAAPFLRDDTWLKPFGSIMVRWPLRPKPTGNKDWITRLVLFDDGVRIDFQVTASGAPEIGVHDRYYRVILDKDGIADSLAEQSLPDNIISAPSLEDYQDRLNAFWWDIVYIAKGLWRGELNYARYMLDANIRFKKLVPLLTWYVGIHHGWDTEVGIYGRWLFRFLDDATWDEYVATFAGSNPEHNWSALFAAMALVRRIGLAIGESLGYEYPAEVDRKVSAFIQSIRELP